MFVKTLRQPGTPERALIERGAHNYFYLQRLQVRNVPARLPLIRELVAGQKVLHVGCTDFPVFDPNNNLHIQIADVCGRLDGLDTDRAGMEQLATYVPGHYFASPDEISASYDLVLVPETIEHVHDIRQFLTQLDTIDFRRIFITAPCLLGWNACFNYRDYPGWRHQLLDGPDDYLEEIHPDHKAWFTPYTLANCVQQFTAWHISEIAFLEGKRMVSVLCEKRPGGGVVPELDIF